MNTYYVTLDTQGYIDSWSDIEFSHSTEIQSDESLVGKLGYVKVIEGVASVDTDKEQELNQKPNIETDELEILKQSLLETQKIMTVLSMKISKLEGAVNNE